MKIRDAIKLIEADGWEQVAQRGSHRQFKHATKAGRVTIAGKPSEGLQTDGAPVPPPTSDVRFVDAEAA